MREFYHGPIPSPTVFPSAHTSYKLSLMAEFAGKNTVKVLAHSPGKYPILIIETADGKLLATYSETGYDLEKSKPVGRAWIRDNAIGRHSFVGVDPPEEVPVSELGSFIN